MISAAHRFAPRLTPGLLALFAAVQLHAQSSPVEPAPLRVGLYAAAEVPEPLRQAWPAVLARAAGGSVPVTPATRHADGKLSLLSLGAVDVAVFVHGPGPLSESDAAGLRRFLGAGKGLVVLGAERDLWTAVPDFLSHDLGAEPAGVFAKGAAMRVINLFPHPIYAGVTRFETEQGMPLWKTFADDAQLIMEGTVGEDTAPLAWVRRREAGRLCHIVPAGAAVWGDASYLQIVAQAALWSGGRPIPRAQPIVQRTFMPESYPGSFAITFPNGPGVCFDPVRGGINFIWDGDFVDLRPRWLTKQGAPPRIFGPVFYRETVWQPQRLGGPGADAKYQFRGYALTAGGPEFRYQIDGREVRETLAANAGGTGITRRFRVGAGSAPLWIALEAQTEAEVVLNGVAREGSHAKFGSLAAGEFAIEIRRRAGGARP